MVPKLKEQIENKSLLNHGTWAYYGNPKKVSEIYLFWTSVDTDKVGANKQIPVIKPYIAGNEPFNTLEDAYKAYADVVKNDYPNYKDTLPQ